MRAEIQLEPEIRRLAKEFAERFGKTLNIEAITTIYRSQFDAAYIYTMAGKNVEYRHLVSLKRSQKKPFEPKAKIIKTRKGNVILKPCKYNLSNNNITTDDTDDKRHNNGGTTVD